MRSRVDGDTLVAEISDSTLDYDLNARARLYADAGIAEYWVLDIVGRRLIVHREPAAAGYRIATIYADPLRRAHVWHFSFLLKAPYALMLL